MPPVPPVQTPEPEVEFRVPHLLRDVVIMLVVWLTVTSGAIVWINYDMPGSWPAWLGPDDPHLTH